MNRVIAEQLPEWTPQTAASPLHDPADRGLVQRPMLAPHLEFRPLGGEAALLVSETFSTLLEGKLYVDLAPLLDGARTRREIADALAGRHEALAVQTALVSMASKGYVVSGEFEAPPKLAAWWSALGCTPRYAEKTLAGARIEVVGDDGRLAAALAELGAATGAEHPTLRVVATSDYLAAEHAGRNREQRAAGAPWLLVKADGAWPMFGPVFRPADEGAPCWACLSHRLRGNREVESFLRSAGGDEAAVLARGECRPLMRAARNLAAHEIVQWLLFGGRAALHEHVVSLDTFERGYEKHAVMRRPQCAVCGDERLNQPDREPEPVRLRSSPKPIANSGGLRSVPPEETVRRHARLVSPISGVVTQLMRTSGAGDSWMHVCWAGSNMALKNDSLHMLRKSLRSKSSGKGASPEQAEASALGEAVERYSGVFHGDEIRRRAAWRDFSDGEALRPNEVMGFSDRQYERAAEINRLRLRFHHVPARFEESARMDWSPVWSLTQGRHRYLPTDMLYYSRPLETDKLYCGPDSNGCAAGNTLEEAVLQGFFELVERDAFACWWYNRARRPEVDLDAFGDPWLSAARGYYGEYRRDVWLLDLTHDLGIPVFAAVSRRTDKPAEDILYSAGAHADPRIAAFRAVCELNQYLSAVRDIADDGGGDYPVDDPESVWWWRNATLAGHPYLAPDPDAPRRGPDDFPQPPRFTDLRDDVEWCRSLVEGKGLEFLVQDQTRPDVGMPVARTIVPGMRHFWPRFAPGRLYDVPVAEGWLDEPVAEQDLNPVAVFI